MTTFVESGRDVAFLRCGMVNVAALGSATQWILIDAGLPGYGPSIREAAQARFGSHSRPAAIVLSHGHFDHVGGLDDLLGSWDVPVYAHSLELPYVTGRSPYPPPDPLVGGGSMALLSRLYPRGPIDLGDRVKPLPAAGFVPGAATWRWIHTPGHTPGHVSFFRDDDQMLVSADAVITTRQESLIAVLTQRRELHGPPAYFTQDWDASRESVKTLAALRPELLIPGHGEPWGGETMRARLDELAERFDALERPRFGRYAKQPAVADDRGVIVLPPDPLPAVLAAVGAVTAAAGLVYLLYGDARRRSAGAYR